MQKGSFFNATVVCLAILAILGSTAVIFSQDEGVIGNALVEIGESDEVVKPDMNVSTAVVAGPNDVFLPFIAKPAVLSPFEQQVLDIVNSERATAGCDPLVANELLTMAARNHNQDMIDNDFFEHEGSNGSSPEDRIAEVGYRHRGWGENIAAGYSSPTSVMNGWMTSTGHRANILNCSFEEIGIGYTFGSGSDYGHYWTQVFGIPR